MKLSAHLTICKVVAFILTHPVHAHCR